MTARVAIVVSLVLTQPWGSRLWCPAVGAAWAIEAQAGQAKQPQTPNQQVTDQQVTDQQVTDPQVTALAERWVSQSRDPASIGARSALTVDRIVTELSERLASLAPALQAEKNAFREAAGHGGSNDRKPGDVALTGPRTSKEILEVRDTLRGTLQALQEGLGPLRELRKELTATHDGLVLEIRALKTLATRASAPTGGATPWTKRAQTLDEMAHTTDGALQSSGELLAATQKAVSRAESTAQTLNQQVTGRTVEQALAVRRQAKPSGDSAELYALLESIGEARAELGQAWRSLAQTPVDGEVAKALKTHGQAPPNDVKVRASRLADLESRFDEALNQFSARLLKDANRIVDSSGRGDRVARLGYTLFARAMQAMHHKVLPGTAQVPFFVNFQPSKAGRTGAVSADELATYMKREIRRDLVGKYFIDGARAAADVLDLVPPETVALAFAHLAAVDCVFHRANEKRPAGIGYEEWARLLTQVANSTFSVKARYLQRDYQISSPKEWTVSATSVVRSAANGPFADVASANRWTRWLRPFARDRSHRLRAGRALPRLKSK